MHCVVHCFWSLYLDIIHGHFLKKSIEVTPRIWGITTWYHSLGMRIPRTRWGTGLDHASIVHFDDLNCDVCVAYMFVLNMCD